MLLTDFSLVLLAGLDFFLFKKSEKERRAESSLRGEQFLKEQPIYALFSS